MRRSFTSHFLPLILLGAGACIGNIGGVPDGQGSSDASEAGDETQDDLVLADGGLRRLTAAEYRRSLHVLLGSQLDAAVIDEAADRFGTIETAFQGGLSSIAATDVGYSDGDLVVTEEVAAGLSRKLFAQSEGRVEFVGCDPVAVTDPCVDSYFERLGRRSFRRPLSSTELGQLQALAAEGADSLGMWVGIEVATAALLQSPYFLYRVELGADEPDDTGMRPFTEYEMASRIAFFITGAPPDDAGLDAAEAGKLSSEDGLSAEVDRLLASPSANQSLRLFFAEWFALDGLENVTKDPALFDAWTPEIAKAMRTEIEMLLDAVVIEGRADFRSLFNHDATFLNDTLAGLYGLTDAYEAAGGTDNFVEIDLAGTNRGGLLTTGGMLAMQSRETRTSPTLRGHFMRTMLLCEKISDPPANVDPFIPEADDEDVPTTLRDRQSKKVADPSCQGCHVLMDPLGYGLENFDAIGRYRKLDNDLPIDSTGSLDGEDFADAAGLGNAMAKEPRVTSCLVRQLYRQAAGHVDISSERKALEAVSDLYLTTSNLDDVRRGIILSQVFRYADDLR